MFNNLRNEIVELNKDVNNVANSERAKALRKKLITIGLVLAILGFGGVFVCFILFVTAGMDAFGDNGFTPRVLVPFILLMPCALIGSLGAAILRMGLSIAITGYTSKLVNDTVVMKCPDCGDPISKDELFCTKCGRKLRNQCSKCGHINEPNDKFCSKCGKEL